MLIDDIEKRMRLDEMESNLEVQFGLLAPTSGAALSHQVEWYERNRQFIRDMRWLIAKVRRLQNAGF